MTFAIAILGVSLLAVGITYAAGRIPGANGVIQGCYDSGGNLKVVASLPCPKRYTPLAWNQLGPPAEGSASAFFANVAPDGTVVDSSPGVTAARIGTGDYQLTFPRPIAHCAATLSTGTNANGGNHNVNGTWDVNLQQPDAPGNLVQVYTYFPDESLSDSAFHLIVVC
ncbi:MAG TPA: hypothetical protein VEH79_05890 [Gaiellaceae bacterium]|nr:hypothetical protein [Gaiellaceae bacterium]